MIEKIRTSFLSALIIVSGVLLITNAANAVFISRSSAEERFETETETEKETEFETEFETETESPILYAPDLTITGTVVGGYAGTITIQTEDGEEYAVSFVNAKTDFSDSGLYDGMSVNCILEDTASDENGIFTAAEITKVMSWN